MRLPILLGQEFVLVDLAAAALVGVAGAFLPLVRNDHLPELLLACNARFPSTFNTDPSTEELLGQKEMHEIRGEGASIAE